MTKITEKLAALGIVLPNVPAPLAAYIPAQKVGNMVFTSGQLPLKNGILVAAGKLGDAVSESAGKEAAETAALNAVAAVSSVCGGIENIVRIIKMTVFVQSTPVFTNQPEVANGASELLVKIFEDNGKHARSAVGVPSLPRNAAVEVELIAEVL